MSTVPDISGKSRSACRSSRRGMIVSSGGWTAILELFAKALQ